MFDANDPGKVEAWRRAHAEWVERNHDRLAGGQAGEAIRKGGYPDLGLIDIPWTPLPKPLSDVTLAVVTTAGYYLRDEQPPFDAAHMLGDPTHRRLPVDVAPSRLEIAHDHYPHDAALEDWNVVLPLDHLRAMVDQGQLGSIGAVFSISGFATNAADVYELSAVPIAEQARAAGCDAALIVPV